MVIIIASGMSSRVESHARLTPPPSRPSIPFPFIHPPLLSTSIEYLFHESIESSNANRYYCEITKDNSVLFLGLSHFSNTFAIPEHERLWKVTGPVSGVDRSELIPTQMAFRFEIIIRWKSPVRWLIRIGRHLLHDRVKTSYDISYDGNAQLC